VLVGVLLYLLLIRVGRVLDENDEERLRDLRGSLPKSLHPVCDALLVCLLRRPAPQVQAVSESF
jgi:hypothetical protein